MSEEVVKEYVKLAKSLKSDNRNSVKHTADKENTWLSARWHYLKFKSAVLEFS